MQTEMITTEYADNWPLAPWAAAVRTGADLDAARAAAPAWTPDAGSAETAARKERDRGASAVEWVVITGIVVAIVGLVGGIIYQSINKKAQSTDQQIQDVNATNTGN